jgi:O-antigen ligase
MTAVVALLALPLAAALVMACIRQPMRVALPLFAALIPFGGRFSIGTSPFGSLSSLVGLLLVLALLFQLIGTHNAAPRIPPDVPVWLVFLGVAAATTQWSVDLSATVQGVLVLGSLVALYALVALAPVDAIVIRRTENGMLLGSVGAVCYGLIQLLFLGGFPAHSGVGTSPTGRFGNDLIEPNLQAVAMILPLVIALNRAFTAGPRKAHRELHAAVAALMLLGILMTGSRGGLLAAAVGVGVSALVGLPAARRKILSFGSVGVVVAAVVWVYHPGGVALRVVDSVTSSSGRTDIWQVGARACREYCASGSGWGTFPTVYANTQATVPGARVLAGNGHYQPHNVWLLVAVELGFLGLLLMAAGVLVAVLEVRKLSRLRRGPAAGSLAGLLAGVMFLSSLEFKFFWMVLIIVVINRNLERTEAAEPAREAAPAAGRSG